ncbi:hypothetical protein D3C76_1578450 [compost metagenome]
MACGSFVLTILLEIPFMNTTLYVGPVANALDGVDLAWVVGLLVPALTYYGAMRRRVAPARSGVPAGVEPRSS